MMEFDWKINNVLVKLEINFHCRKIAAAGFIRLFKNCFEYLLIPE